LRMNEMIRWVVFAGSWLLVAGAEPAPIAE
jgi:hypothetical protein